MAENQYERTEKDIIDNAPIVLFKVGDKPISVKVRSIATVDEWLKDADAVMQMGLEATTVFERFGELQAEYLERFRQFQTAEANGEGAPTTPPAKGLSFGPKPEASPPTEEALEELRDRMNALRETWRMKLRAYLDAAFACICMYDPQIDRQKLESGGITDGQVLSAFARLRYFSDPLAAQRIVTAALTRAQIAATRAT